MAEAIINSIVMIARTVLVESRLGGLFWFRAVIAGKDAQFYVQGTDQCDSIPGHVRLEERIIRLPSIQMQSLGLPRQATPRERKAHAKGKGNSRCWIHTKYDSGGRS